MKKTIDDFTCIGKIINTHRLKGELKIEPLTSNIKRFSDLDRVFVGKDLEIYDVKKVRYAKGFVYLTFLDNEDIDSGLKLKTKEIYIPTDERIDLPEDEFFISDLIGKDVYDLDKKYVGVVKDIYEYPANDVLVIENQEGKEIQIPFVKEFIKSINEIVVVDLIEGMII